MKAIAIDPEDSLLGFIEVPKNLPYRWNIPIIREPRVTAIDSPDIYNLESNYKSYVYVGFADSGYPVYRLEVE